MNKTITIMIVFVYVFMAPSLSEYTAINEIPNIINVDFMLPYGLYSTLACSK
jgi:hypothetical protein